MKRLILYVILVGFSTFALASSPSGVNVKAGQIPEEIAVRIYEKFTTHFAKAFPSSGMEGFQTEFCRVNGIKEACSEPLTEARTLYLPGIPDEVIRHLEIVEQNMAKTLEANTLLKDKIELVKISRAQTEGERNALSESLSRLTNEYGALSEDNAMLSSALAATADKLTESEHEKNALKERAFLIGKSIALIVLVVLLSVLVSSRRKIAKKDATIRNIAEVQSLKPKRQEIAAWVEVPLPDTVPDVVKREYGPNAKSLQRLYGRKSIMLKQAQAQEGRDTLVSVDGIKGVFSPHKGRIFKALREPKVIETILSRLEAQAA